MTTNRNSRVGFPLGVQNIIDAGGFGLALTGMTIVFISLVLVSLFISSLPRLLPTLNSILPVVEGHHGAPMPSPVSQPASANTDDELIAVIGYALHHRRNG